VVNINEVTKVMDKSHTNSQCSKHFFLLEGGCGRGEVRKGKFEREKSQKVHDVNVSALLLKYFFFQELIKIAQNLWRRNR
jgi:hypothetical protein